MATNVTQFNGELVQALEASKRDTIVLHRRQVLTFVQVVAGRTPIDTGHAQANWVAYVGPGSDIELFNEPQTIQQIRDRSASNLRRLKFGDVVTVVNNAPYISFLNEGSSKQAPAGFIEAAEAIVNAAFP